ncbi:MAG: hypothetical protein EPO00_12655 [Chloroflexota bacterium]|nr:MAG: hypothetical protein EPO00_12655 [Chloroflexota bacterium]
MSSLSGGRFELPEDSSLNVRGGASRDLIHQADDVAEREGSRCRFVAKPFVERPNAPLEGEDSLEQRADRFDGVEPAFDLSTGFEISERADEGVDIAVDAVRPEHLGLFCAERALLLDQSRNLAVKPIHDDPDAKERGTIPHVHGQPMLSELFDRHGPGLDVRPVIALPGRRIPGDDHQRVVIGARGDEVFEPS